MARQHAEDVEIQRVPRVPGAGAGHLLTRYAEQRPDSGVFVVAPLTDIQSSRVGATFLQRYPNSRLDIRLVDNMVDPIKDGFDVVFGTGPLQDSNLIARKVFSFELFLCASPDFVRHLEAPITDPTQLNSLAFIDFGFGGPHKLTVANHKRRYELSLPRICRDCARCRQQPPPPPPQ